MDTVKLLRDLFKENIDKCIAVIGPTCVGKTTMMKDFPEAVAISSISPPLTEIENQQVRQTPWTEEIGELVNTIKGKKAKIEPGRPAFGTVIPSNTQLIIYLTISDDLLKRRTEMRRVSFIDAKRMQKWIEKKIKESKLTTKIVNIK